MRANLLARRDWASWLGLQAPEARRGFGTRLDVTQPGPNDVGGRLRLREADAALKARSNV